VFDEFPAKLVIDATHPTDLKSEYLLNEDGLLEVVKVYSCAGKGKLKSVFARVIHPTAEGVQRPPDSNDYPAQAACSEKGR